MVRVALAVPAEQVEVRTAVVGSECAIGLIGWRDGRSVTLDAMWASSAHAGSAIAVKAAEELLVLPGQSPRLLGVCGWDNVPIVVLRDCQEPEEVVDVVGDRAN